MDVRIARVGGFGPDRRPGEGAREQRDKAPVALDHQMPGALKQVRVAGGEQNLVAHALLPPDKQPGRGDVLATPCTGGQGALLPLELRRPEAPFMLGPTLTQNATFQQKEPEVVVGLRELRIGL